MTHHWNMAKKKSLKKFEFRLSWERTETVQIEAASAEEARDLIMSGEADYELINVNDDDVDCDEGVEVK